MSLSLWSEPMLLSLAIPACYYAVICKQHGGITAKDGVRVPELGIEDSWKLRCPVMQLDPVSWRERPIKAFIIA